LWVSGVVGKLGTPVQLARFRMNNKLFVGNIPFTLSEPNLEELFAKCGKVVSVTIPTDRETGRKRGFAFVEMETQAEAESAIRDLNGQTLEGRQIVVNPSRPKTQNGGGSRDFRR
jgi:RNA recognition motif-containing protein